MRKQLLYSLWAVLYVVCAGLSLLGANTAVKNIFALLFFVPPVLLLALEGKRDGKFLLILSAAVLALTVICLISAALSARSDGKLLTMVTALVTAPMLCCTYWPESVFLWACLLFGSIQKLRQKT